MEPYGDPRGKKAKGGAALDVIVVIPSQLHHHTGSSTSERHDKSVDARNDGGSKDPFVVASSDFVVQFPDDSSVGKNFVLPDVPCDNSSASFCCDGACGRGLETTASYKEEGWQSSQLVSKEQSQTECTNDDGSELQQKQPARRGDISVFINGRYTPQLFMRRKSGGTCKFVQGDSLKPCSSILKSLVEQKIISPGKKLLRYVHGGGSKRYLEANLYLWDSSDSVIVSDIDGTVTKSDVSGVLDTIFREAYTHVHRGICKFFTDLVNLTKQDESHGIDEVSTPKTEPKIRIVYLTSRPLSLLDSTRKFLHSLEQESFKLPPGPVFCHLGGLSEVLVTELWRRNTHEFKADVLARQVVVPFAAAGRKSVSIPTRKGISGTCTVPV